MDKKERALRFAQTLNEIYPDAVCSLDYETPFRLLCAVQLSAQCTDARVNLVTPALFERYPSSAEMADADLSELEEIIKPCGFYHNKAKNLIACAKRIEEVYGGNVPDNMDDLLTLAGVGRKTANLVLGDIYNQGGMVIDTHAKRILNRMGLTEFDDPVKIEFDTEKLFPREMQSGFCHRIVLFGRDTCSARKPKCAACPASSYCPKIIK
ncbi:MAG: endonuclease III [Clostridia bacterium]|nr:endonuclease III [Clostridia bacterium]